MYKSGQIIPGASGQMKKCLHEMRFCVAVAARAVRVAKALHALKQVVALAVGEVFPTLDRINCGAKSEKNKSSVHYMGIRKVLLAQLEECT